MSLAGFTLKHPTIVTTGVLLLTYRWGVRYTAIGRLLNGPRPSPVPSSRA